MSAYPHDRIVKARAEAILKRFDRRVERLEEEGADLSELDALGLGGMAGTVVATEFTWDMARWLTRRQAGLVTASWDVHEQPERLGAAWPRFLPLLEEEALADAGVPYLEWLAAARRAGERDLEWLLSRFERLELPDRRVAELFDAQGVVLSWALGRSRFTRTLLRKSGPSVFFHREPLLSRRDVSLAGTFASAPMPVRRCSRPEGERVLDMARGGTAARYRELHGFTHGDPSTVLAARPGRGVEIFFFGVGRESRLPLRAAYAALIFKSGVPVGYFEGLSLLDRLEVGFNVYYTFREGESAWLFAQMLKLCGQVTGARSFSIDPYQIGRENDEAIDSGAFWFYRKLGFRPTHPRIAALVAREEERMKLRPEHRTHAATLRRIAMGNLLYDVGSPKSKVQSPKGPWDRFHIRNIGLAVNRRMALRFGGDAERIRKASVASVKRKLEARASRWSEGERNAFANFALVLDLIPDLSRWSREEKSAAIEVIRAKAGRSETRYLRLSQRHERLRTALIRLGSLPSPPGRGSG